MSNRSASVFSAISQTSSRISRAGSTRGPQRADMRISRLDYDSASTIFTNTTKRTNLAPRHYVVNAMVNDNGRMKGPVMYGYINAMDEIHQPVEAPRGDFLAEKYTDLSITSSSERSALPLLHHARTLLNNTMPEALKKQSRLSRGDFGVSVLKPADLFYLTDANFLRDLDEKNLLDLVRSLRNTTKSAEKTPKGEICKLLLKYLFETRLNTIEALRSSHLSRAKQIANKLLAGESTAPNSPERFELDGILALAPSEIRELSLETIYQDFIHDYHGILHLNANQMMALIDSVKSFSSQMREPYSPELLALRDFIKDIVMDNLALSVRDMLDDFALNTQVYTADLRARIKAVRSVMREARSLNPAPVTLDILSLRPEQIALLGSHDLMALNHHDIARLDHAQAMAFSLIMNEMGKTMIKGNFQAIENKFHLVMSALRERVRGVMAYVGNNEISKYVKRATALINETDKMVYQREVETKYPLILVTPHSEDKIDPIRFVQAANFSSLTSQDIQLLDKDSILSMPPDEQLKWFISNDAQAILSCDDPDKIWYWIQLLKYLHHKSPASSQFCIAIEQQVALLRYGWLNAIQNTLPDFSKHAAKYKDILDSIFEVAFARQQIGANNLISLQAASPAKIKSMSANALLRCDISEFSQFSSAKVMAFTQAAWNHIGRRTDELTAPHSTTFALYRKLSWLHQHWSIRHHSLNTNPNATEIEALDALENVLAACVDAMPKVEPFVSLPDDLLDGKQSPDAASWVASLSQSTESVNEWHLYDKSLAQIRNLALDELTKLDFSTLGIVDTNDKKNKLFALLKQSSALISTASQAEKSFIEGLVGLVNRDYISGNKTLADPKNIWKNAIKEQVEIINKKLAKTASKELELFSINFASLSLKALFKLQSEFLQLSRLNSQSEAQAVTDYIKALNQYLPNASLQREAEIEQIGKAIFHFLLDENLVHARGVNLQSISTELAWLSLSIQLNQISRIDETRVNEADSKALFASLRQIKAILQDEIFSKDRLKAVNAFVQAQMARFVDNDKSILKNKRELSALLRSILLLSKSSVRFIDYSEHAADSSDLSSESTLIEELDVAFPRALLPWEQKGKAPQAESVSEEETVRKRKIKMPKARLPKKPESSLDSSDTEPSQEKIRVRRQVKPKATSSSESTTESEKRAKPRRLAKISAKDFAGAAASSSSAEEQAIQESLMGQYTLVGSRLANKRALQSAKFSNISLDEITDANTPLDTLLRIQFDSIETVANWQTKVLSIVHALLRHTENADLDNIERIYTMMTRIHHDFIANDRIKLGSASWEKVFLEEFQHLSQAIASRYAMIKHPNALTRRQAFDSKADISELSLPEMLNRVHALKIMGYLSTQAEKQFILSHLARLFELSDDISLSDDRQTRQAVNDLLHGLYEKYILLTMVEGEVDHEFSTRLQEYLNAISLRIEHGFITAEYVVDTRPLNHEVWATELVNALERLTALWVERQLPPELVTDVAWTADEIKKHYVEGQRGGKFLTKQIKNQMVRALDVLADPNFQPYATILEAPLLPSQPSVRAPKKVVIADVPAAKKIPYAMKLPTEFHFSQIGEAYAQFDNEALSKVVFDKPIETREQAEKLLKLLDQIERMMLELQQRKTIPILQVERLKNTMLDLIQKQNQQQLFSEAFIASLGKKQAEDHATKVAVRMVSIANKIEQLLPAVDIEESDTTVASLYGKNWQTLSSNELIAFAPIFRRHGPILTANEKHAVLSYLMALNHRLDMHFFESNENTSGLHALTNALRREYIDLERVYPADQAFQTHLRQLVNAISIRKDIAITQINFGKQSKPIADKNDAFMLVDAIKRLASIWYDTRIPIGIRPDATSFIEEMNALYIQGTHGGEHLNKPLKDSLSKALNALAVQAFHDSDEVWVDRNGQVILPLSQLPALTLPPIKKPRPVEPAAKIVPEMPSEIIVPKTVTRKSTTKDQKDRLTLKKEFKVARSTQRTLFADLTLRDLQVKSVYELSRVRFTSQIKHKDQRELLEAYVDELILRIKNQDYEHPKGITRLENILTALLRVEHFIRNEQLIAPKTGISRAFSSNLEQWEQQLVNKIQRGINAVSGKFPDLNIDAFLQHTDQIQAAQREELFALLPTATKLGYLGKKGRHNVLTLLERLIHQNETVSAFTPQELEVLHDSGLTNKLFDKYFILDMLIKGKNNQPHTKFKTQLNARLNVLDAIFLKENITTFFINDSKQLSDTDAAALLHQLNHLVAFWVNEEIPDAYRPDLSTFIQTFENTFIAPDSSRIESALTAEWKAKALNYLNILKRTDLHRAQPFAESSVVSEEASQPKVEDKRLISTKLIKSNNRVSHPNCKLSVANKDNVYGSHSPAKLAQSAKTVMSSGLKHFKFGPTQRAQLPSFLLRAIELSSSFTANQRADVLDLLYLMEHYVVNKTNQKIWHSLPENWDADFVHDIRQTIFILESAKKAAQDKTKQGFFDRINPFKRKVPTSVPEVKKKKPVQALPEKQGFFSVRNPFKRKVKSEHPPAGVKSKKGFFSRLRNIFTRKETTARSDSAPSAEAKNSKRSPKVGEKVSLRQVLNRNDIG